MHGHTITRPHRRMKTEASSDISFKWNKILIPGIQPMNPL